LKLRDAKDEIQDKLTDLEKRLKECPASESGPIKAEIARVKAA